ncbi:butyrophilin-like protein 2 [Solea solea]|uniref:butyrophilin-like protein 2 n=1 Tax=Solea solea TaxID=90069 RepID=UPI00272954D7|nr:butyrophilin-like protein 2 [Solea solea]
MENLGKIIFYSMIVLTIVFWVLIILFLCLAFSTPSYGVLSSNTTPIGELGKAQLLSCYLTTQSISQVSVSWEKKGVEGLIYQYRSGAANLGDQNSEFRGRTELFPDALVTGNASLLLRNVTSTDEGEYTCSISSYMGEGKVNIYLKTAAVSYDVLSTNKTAIRFLGEDQLLSCYLTPQNTEQVSVSWAKKGMEGFVYQYSNGSANLTYQNSQFTGRAEMFPDALVTGNASLLLRNVRPTDDGEYTCNISSSTGQGEVNIYLKTAAVSYDVLSTNKTAIRFLGEDQLLSCYLTPQNIEQVSVSWAKKGMEGFVYQYSNGSANLTNQNSQFTGRAEMFPDALVTGNASLLLRNVRPTDDGEYTCNISSSTGQGEVNIYLRTAEILYDVMSTNKTPITILGEDQLLSCYMTTPSLDQVSVTWVKKGVEFFFYQYSNGAVNISDQSSEFRGRTEVFPDDLIRGNASLLLRGVTRTDAGEYTCTIRSSTGKGKVNIYLRTAVKTCPDGWTTAQSSCYLFSTTYGSWYKGRKDCMERGADLVTIGSTEEQMFICKMSRHDIWIGLTDRLTEGDWIWTDGRPLTLPFWQTFQPDNGRGDPANGEEDCAVLRPRVNFNRNWNDLRCDASLSWLCEKNASLLIED